MTRALDPNRQVVLAYRDTGQTLVTTASDYISNSRTKYRNWRLSARADFVGLPFLMSRYLPLERRKSCQPI